MKKVISWCKNKLGNNKLLACQASVMAALVGYSAVSEATGSGFTSIGSMASSARAAASSIGSMMQNASIIGGWFCIIIALAQFAKAASSRTQSSSAHPALLLGVGAGLACWPVGIQMVENMLTGITGKIGDFSTLLGS